MYIAVDFDGTVVDHCYPLIGTPNPGAIEWMKTWAEVGGKIIVFTMRDGEELDEAVEYLVDNEVPLYGVNINPDQISWTDSNKAYAHVYVDDLAFGMPMHQPDHFHRPAVDWSKVGPGVYGKIIGVENPVN